MQASSVIAGIVLILVAGGLMTADLIVRELPRQASETVAMEPDPIPVAEPTTAPSSEASESSSSSSRRVVKKGVSTKKAQGESVEDILQNLDLTSQETTEKGFLSFLITSSSSVKTSILLKNNDRAFLFSWVEDDNIKPLFNGLKQALSEQFSGKLTDLIDTTKTSDTGPIVDILSFIDPELSPEKVTFVRVRNRLYEIHTAANGTGTLDALIEALSQ